LAALVALAALAAMIALSACAAKANDAPQSEQQAKGGLVMEFSADATDELAITNKTGMAITGVSMREVGAQEGFGDNLLSGGVVWEAGEPATIRFNRDANDESAAPAAAPAAAANGGSPQGSGATSPLSYALLKSAYDVRLDFEDGTQCVLHGVSLNDLEEASINIKDGIAYLAYRVGGTQESTLVTEQALADANGGATGNGSSSGSDKAADGSASANDSSASANDGGAGDGAAAGSASAAAGSASANKSSDSMTASPQTNGGFSFDYGTGSGASAPAPAQSSDACLDGAVLN
jgi:hypothetical protein